MEYSSKASAVSLVKDLLYGSHDSFYCEESERGPVLVGRSKWDCDTSYFPLLPKAALVQSVKLNLEGLEKNLESNEFYRKGVTESQDWRRNLERKEANLYAIARAAVEEIMSESPHLQDLAVLDWGPHFYKLSSQAKRKGLVYLVNGGRAFRGEFVNGWITWKLVDQDIDEGMLLQRASAGCSWAQVDGIDDLQPKSPEELERDFLCICSDLRWWTRWHPNLDRKFTASFISGLPLIQALGPVDTDSRTLLLQPALPRLLRDRLDFPFPGYINLFNCLTGLLLGYMSDSSPDAARRVPVGLLYYIPDLTMRREALKEELGEITERPISEVMLSILTVYDFFEDDVQRLVSTW